MKLARSKIVLYIMMWNEKAKNKGENMKLKQIYLGVFIFGILGLSIYGFYLKSSNNNSLQNNHPSTEENKSLEEISKYLEELKKLTKLKLKKIIKGINK
ncbi:MAG: hypothetical protein ACQBVK_04270 [Candidatus Phytoplasma sp. TWB_XP]